MDWLTILVCFVLFQLVIGWIKCRPNDDFIPEKRGKFNWPFFILILFFGIPMMIIGAIISSYQESRFEKAQKKGRGLNIKIVRKT